MEEVTYTVSAGTINCTDIYYPSTTDNTWFIGDIHYDPYPFWRSGYMAPSKEDMLVKTQKRKEDNLMRIYEVIVVDAKECEIIKEQNVVAKDTETAMLEVELTPEMRKKVKKGEIKFIFNELGSFEKVERQIRVKELAEDD